MVSYCETDGCANLSLFISTATVAIFAQQCAFLKNYKPTRFTCTQYAYRSGFMSPVFIKPILKECEILIFIDRTQCIMHSIQYQSYTVKIHKETQFSLMYLNHTNISRIKQTSENAYFSSRFLKYSGGQMKINRASTQISTFTKS